MVLSRLREPQGYDHEGCHHGWSMGAFIWLYSQYSMRLSVWRLVGIFRASSSCPNIFSSGAAGFF